MRATLPDAALDVQRRSLRGETGHAGPDFGSVLENPLGDAESAGYRLVTRPRMGLERVRAPRT